MLFLTSVSGRRIMHDKGNERVTEELGMTDYLTMK
jgi:hypothetical protein